MWWLTISPCAEYVYTSRLKSGGASRSGIAQIVTTSTTRFTGTPWCLFR